MPALFPWQEMIPAHTRSHTRRCPAGAELKKRKTLHARLSPAAPCPQRAADSWQLLGLVRV